MVLIPNEQFFVLILFQYSLTKSEHLFNLKFAAKDLERNAKKCEKSEKEEKGKLKKVIFFYFFFTDNKKILSFCSHFNNLFLLLCHRQHFHVCVVLYFI